MRRRGLVPASLLLALAIPARAEEPGRAEYAARWDPARGGPQTADEAAAVLGAPVSPRRSCEVLYYDVPGFRSAPAGAAVILRRRTCDDGKTEIRLKYRSAHPLEHAACPAGAPFHEATEVDVGFGEGAPSRTYAFACTLSAAEPPAFLHAVAKPCTSRMTRSEARGDGAPWKIEDWILPDGSRRLEISRSSANDVDALAAFEAVVERLRARGARLLDESKTELGSRCPASPAR